MTEKREKGGASSFRSGLLIGGLAVAVFALFVAVIVLAMDDSNHSPPPTVVVGTAALAQEGDGDLPQEDLAGVRQAEHVTPTPVTPSTADLQPKYFETPSKNITCGLSPEGVRCDIAEKDWMPNVPKPKSCYLDWGNGVSLGSEEGATFTCAGDTLLGSAEGELRYGYMIRRGHIRCFSREDGLTCRTPDGAGFLLSKEEVRIF